MAPKYYPMSLPAFLVIDSTLVRFYSFDYTCFLPSSLIFVDKIEIIILNKKKEIETLDLTNTQII